MCTGSVSKHSPATQTDPGDCYVYARQYVSIGVPCSSKGLPERGPVPTCAKHTSFPTTILAFPNHAPRCCWTSCCRPPPKTGSQGDPGWTTALMPSTATTAPTQSAALDSLSTWAGVTLVGHGFTSKAILKNRFLGFAVLLIRGSVRIVDGPCNAIDVQLRSIYCLFRVREGPHRRLLSGKNVDAHGCKRARNLPKPRPHCEAHAVQLNMLLGRKCTQGAWWY